MVLKSVLGLYEVKSSVLGLAGLESVCCEWVRYSLLAN